VIESVDIVGGLISYWQLQSSTTHWHHSLALTLYVEWYLLPVTA